MFVGHAAVALAARSRVRDASLGALLACTFALDLVWPVLLLVGVERVEIQPGASAFTALAFVHYPWSHSLLAALGWGATATLVVSAFGASRRTALACGAVVVSHWLLDLVTHVPDLPLWPGDSPVLGLGLWNSVVGTYLVEGALFLMGIAAYTHATLPRDRVGALGFWILAVVLLLVWAPSPWAPPPPSVTALALVALAVWLFVAWAEWVDRHRDPRGSAPAHHPG